VSSIDIEMSIQLLNNILLLNLHDS